jgi:hypothetical protein
MSSTQAVLERFSSAKQVMSPSNEFAEKRITVNEGSTKYTKDTKKGNFREHTRCFPKWEIAQEM